MILLIVYTLITTSASVAILILVLDYKKRPIKRMKKHRRKVLSSYVAHTIFIIARFGLYPIVQVLSTSFVCSSSSINLISENDKIFKEDTGQVCFGFQHILNLSLSAISAVGLIIILRTSELSFFDPNPKSKQAYARMSQGYWFLSLLPNLVVPVFSILDYSAKIRVWVLIFAACFMLVEIIS